MNTPVLEIDLFPWQVALPTVFLFMDVLKRHMKGCDVDPSQWEELASGRGEWRLLVQQTISNFEIHRLSELDSKRNVKQKVVLQAT